MALGIVPAALAMKGHQMIYETTASPKAIERAQSFAANPPKQTQYSPVPFVLLRAITRHNSPGQEYVPDPRTKAWEGEPDYGAYAGETFDPWRKGDLIAHCLTSSVWTQGKGNYSYDRWFITRRAKTPSVEATKRADRNVKLYRIPYRYLQRAHDLVGQQFETREAIEAALTAASSFAIAAE